MSKLQQLRRKNRDWLLTLLTAVLTLMIFVFAPLQAAGFFLFHAFAFLFELCHPDINRLRRYRSRAPLARSLCNVESIIGQLYPATILARLVTLELRAGST
jgi:hypothetical protein